MRGALAVIFSLLLLASTAMAIDVPSFQKQVSIELIAGEQYQFHLLLRDLKETATITAEGDAGEWVSFGENRERTIGITNLVNQGLLVTVFAPSNADKKTYTATIKANGNTLTTLSISIVSPFSSRLDSINADIETLKAKTSTLEESQTKTQGDTESLKGQQDNLMKLMESTQGNIEKVSDLVSDVKKLTGDANDIRSSYESEKTNLNSRIGELQGQINALTDKNKELTGITGGFTMATSASAFGGFIAGCLLMAFVLGRARMPSFRLPKGGGSKPYSIPKHHAPKEEKTKFEPVPAQKEKSYRYSFRINRR